MRTGVDRPSWGAISIALHWLVAICVFGLFGLGWWMTGLDYYHAWYKQGPDLHKSIGVMVLGLLLLRLVWRLFNGRPAPLPTHGEWEIRLTHLVHLLLYLLLFAIITSGYLISTADGRPISVFDWFELPPLQLGIEQQADIAGTIHWYLALILISLVVVHAAGAMKHHFIDKDETLKRMLRTGKTD